MSTVLFDNEVVVAVGLGFNVVAADLGGGEVIGTVASGKNYVLYEGDEKGREGTFDVRRCISKTVAKKKATINTPTSIQN